MRGHMTHLEIVSLQFLDFITLDSSLIAVLEFSLYGTRGINSAGSSETQPRCVNRLSDVWSSEWNGADTEQNRKKETKYSPTPE